MTDRSCRQASWEGSPCARTSPDRPTTLIDYPKIADVVVIGHKDPEWGRRVHAIIAPTDPASPPTAEEVRAYAKSRLLAYKVPKAVEIVAAIPRSEATKENRGRLVAERDTADYLGVGPRMLPAINKLRAWRPQHAIPHQMQAAPGVPADRAETGPPASTRRDNVWLCWTGTTTPTTSGSCSARCRSLAGACWMSAAAPERSRPGSLTAVSGSMLSTAPRT